MVPLPPPFSHPRRWHSARTAVRMATLSMPWRSSRASSASWSMGAVDPQLLQQAIGDAGVADEP
jgi:hypothetical protein